MKWSHERRTQRGNQVGGRANQNGHRRGAGKPGQEHDPRRKGQGYPGRIHEGFLKYSDPTAWGRVIRMLKCNTVYLARYRSMKIPISFQTTYARADKQILVDSGATDNFIHPPTPQHSSSSKRRTENYDQFRTTES